MLVPSARLSLLRPLVGVVTSKPADNGLVVHINHYHRKRYYCICSSALSAPGNVLFVNVLQVILYVLAVFALIQKDPLHLVLPHAIFSLVVLSTYHTSPRNLVEQYHLLLHLFYIIRLMAVVPTLFVSLVLMVLVQLFHYFLSWLALPYLPWYLFDHICCFDHSNLTDILCFNLLLTRIGTVQFEAQSAPMIRAHACKKTIQSLMWVGRTGGRSGLASQGFPFVCNSTLLAPRSSTKRKGLSESWYIEGSNTVDDIKCTEAQRDGIDPSISRHRAR